MSLHLELGDVIKVVSPDDKTLNKIIFLITYIDDNVMSIKNLPSRFSKKLCDSMPAR